MTGLKWRSLYHRTVEFPLKDTWFERPPAFLKSFFIVSSYISYLFYGQTCLPLYLAIYLAMYAAKTMHSSYHIYLLHLLTPFSDLRIPKVTFGWPELSFKWHEAIFTCEVPVNKVKNRSKYYLATILSFRSLILSQLCGLNFGICFGYQSMEKKVELLYILYSVSEEICQQRR